MLDWHQWLHFSRWGWLFNFHTLVVWLFGGFGVAIHKWRQRARENRAASWPSTDAVIQAIHLKPNNGYWVEIDYRYYAHQEYRYGKYRRHFRRKSKAQEFADSARGRTLLVRYNDSDPNLSVIMERDLHMTGQLQTR